MPRRIDRVRANFNGHQWTIKLIHGKPPKTCGHEGLFCERTRTLTIYLRGTDRSPVHIVLHEALHALCPNWTEEHVDAVSLALATALLKAGLA